MKEAMASNVEGRGLAKSDAIDHERGRSNVRGRVQIFLFGMINLGTEKKNGSCLLWCMFQDGKDSKERQWG